MTAEMPLAYDVFVSHSSKDKKWADAACAVLERHRIRCWIAPRDIVPGDEWGAAIVKGIQSSRMMVLIFSANANESPQVRREVERAISRGQTVLPIRIENVPPDGALEFALSNTHWLDAFTPPVEDQLTRLARSVRTLLDATATENPKPSAAAESAAIPTQTATIPVIPEQRKSAFTWMALAVGAGVLALVALGVMIFSGSPPSPGSDPEKTSTNSSSTAALKEENAVFGERMDVIEMMVSGARKKSSSWELRSRVLTSTGKENEPLALPVTVPDEYQLVVSVCRARPGLKGEFTIGLLCGDHRVDLIIDGWAGTISGLSLIDGKSAMDNETRIEGRHFDRGRPIEIVSTVQKKSLRVTVDGMPLVNWQGDFARFSSRRASTGGRRVLVFNSYGGFYRIDKITLTPIESSN